MKKILLIIVLLAITGSAYAKENKTTATPEDVPALASEAKPEAAAPKKQNSAKQEAVNLETAYKREFAFLEAQKRELTERLKNYQATANREEQALNSKINALERSSVERSAKIDQLTAQLTESERKEAAVTERSDALETTYLQADATLKNHGIEMPSAMKEEKGNDPVKVDFLFKQALSLLQNLGAIQTKPGNFFLEDGKQTQGNIIHLGNIAAFGASTEGGGSLVPAGGGDFKVWKGVGFDTAAALSKSQQPDLLQLYLFESRTSAIEETPEKTITGIIDSGGPIGWVIVILGGVAAFLILIRAYLLRSNSADTQQLTDQIIQQLASGDLEVAKKSCEDNSSAIGRVLHYTLRHLKDDRDHMEGIVYEAILQESGPLDRFGPAILVIASIAPLLGLLGTVTGMIETFDMITEFGTGDPKLLSEGIAIALVTTELGLIVAIPALLLGSLLSSWARNIKRDMEHSALRIINVFLGGGLDLEEVNVPAVDANNLALSNA
ncbi:MotA/TolQ/ExbB proton channel family protein [Nitrosomonas sp. Nm166]|uniref:MotA/TolQ/ExbB proton channel family protein n=1 Tax=Nitrosomonas sp. Nm166 TaxID=1881054 RepID=UPI0008E7BC0F|nr:MotA/TolQ/ExbB proton channel family protein [Nitrosomonas sp. Nm166]SFE18831.1 biopolymer transport protein ExbB [Nitrosomonas sp. Nm166]